MGYRNAQFASLHAARAAGSSGIDLITGTDADFATTKGRLIDNRAARLVTITPATGDVTLRVDRGAAGLTAVNRLLIPSGHNLSTRTATLEVQADDNAGFSSPTPLYGPTAVGSDGLLDVALTSDTQQYLRLLFTGITGGDVDLGEIVFSNRFEISDGIDPDDWVDELASNVRVDELASGVRIATQLGAARRRIELGWRRLGTANRATLDAMVSAIGGRRDPFWVWTPDDTQLAALVRLESDPTGRQAHPNPALSGPEFDRSFQMLEEV